MTNLNHNTVKYKMRRIYQIGHKSNEDWMDLRNIVPKLSCTTFYEITKVTMQKAYHVIALPNKSFNFQQSSKTSPPQEVTYTKLLLLQQNTQKTNDKIRVAIGNGKYKRALATMSNLKILSTK